jgi:adenine-specific DNA-methyltransferase
MSEKLDRFVGLLRNIFELDKSDLDFGIYRIMNIRKEQIDEFLSKKLPKQVRSILEPVAAGNIGEIRKKMDELKTQASSFGADVEQNAEYRALKEQLLVSADISALETDVYSYLYNFFNRYYDEGDFISKRRYKEGVYSIPYEGEEVKLYWANHDQYYIKTTENFKDYSFISDGITVHFMLVDATTEQNNNKESNGSKRVFMLFTENEEQPTIKTFEVKNNEFIIRFIYDISDERQKIWDEKNYTAIKEFVIHKHDKLMPLITPSLPFNKELISPIQKHLLSYVAKNTFDYFIHKDLGGFLNRELDFFIKNEIIHLDDIDTNKEEHVNKYLAKIRAVKKVGKIIIDFLAQIENFQKRLWLKKKFVVRTDWCITLDRVPEEFYEEIRNNKAQVQEWIELYAIDEVSGNSELGLTAKWSNPPSIEFLCANKNLVIDTKHFPPVFKDALISGIDNLDDTVGGVLIHSENFQALNLLQKKYNKKVDCIHIDPPYNTDTSGFLYKNNYRHSSWLSMMTDRIDSGIRLLNDSASFITHIDENEYERLWQLFEIKPLITTGTIIWDKRNPMTGGSGIATQHEYIIWRDMSIKTVNIYNGAAELMFEKVKELMKQYGAVSDELRKEYTLWLNSTEIFSNGEKAYRYIDDDGNIYQSVSLRAPEPRTDPKFHIPLIHPKTNKPCPVPPNGFSRTPETLKSMMERNEILFGEDENTQPRQK